MSAALLRKGIELVDSDRFATGQPPSQKQPPGITKKQGGRGKKVNASGGQVNTRGRDMLTRKSASVKRLQQNNAGSSGGDRTAENLRCLKMLSETSSVDSATANKLFSRAGKEFKAVKKEKPKKEEKTAFTDEDFAKFEREYFVSK